MTSEGSIVTVTIPTRSDFVPIQSSLPNATYDLEDVCSVSTLTTSSTITSRVSTATTTLSGTIIVFYSEQVAYSSASFTNFSISYATTTSTISKYAATASSTVTTTSTITLTDVSQTTTVYAACATNNFANVIVVDDVPRGIVSFDDTPNNQSFTGVVRDPTGPYDCCNYAFSQGADVWLYDPTTGCSLLVGDEPCTPAATNDTAIISSVLQRGFFPYVFGNAVCGRFTNVAVRIDG